MDWKIELIHVPVSDVDRAREFYERLGWRRFPGDLFVTQRQATVPFTFNLPMTTPIRLQGPPGGEIDLLGPPW